ncbi:PAT family beta-lactamase induction signal transducer AmpG [Pelomonas saccharophila]|uniref:PAT family beta-lactamase induction signal transducer AmpG n=1 Tax=Roseateles saccharophilus TaxID=304 RepID=A0ABU1YUE3_ROSSA|nr:MFS transporter [Roseateles saccharophilus]MDR7271571.1 PAT family beta-lactamase induction signal transducer AmpG [Roseateles saccharophilus]
MRLPNLLASRKGRIAAFFLMYLTEGLPIGFAMTTVATQLRRQGVGTAEIGGFLGLVLLPWAFKWAYGPFIDLIASRRLGPRRGWILGAQGLMIVTLLPLAGLDLATQLGFFTALLIVHNLCGAVQDVAVDALAVTTLHEDERAFASGMMFAGQSLGVLMGGGGALLLVGRIGFDAGIVVLAAIIAAVMGGVVWPMREQAPSAGPSAELAAAGHEVLVFLRQALQALLGSRLAVVGLLFAILPISAMALARGLQSNLAVDLGLSNEQIGWLATASQAATALTCIAGGWLSDRINLRRALASYVALLSLPGLYLMWELQRQGWAPGQAAPAALVTAFMAAVVVYQLLFGFIYGARVAVFIGITQPAVAATQFAAYMALTNLSITYSVVWQGHAVQHWGYAATLGLDALVGLSCLLLLPLLQIKKPSP